MQRFFQALFIRVKRLDCYGVAFGACLVSGVNRFIEAAVLGDAAVETLVLRLFLCANLVSLK